MDKKLKPLLAAAVLWSSGLLAADPIEAFCGFYVAKADAKLFNKASKVVVARKGEQTAVTMASDYQGDPKEFALVIPVPTVVTKKQIKVLESALARRGWLNISIPILASHGRCLRWHRARPRCTTLRRPSLALVPLPWASRLRLNIPWASIIF